MAGYTLPQWLARVRGNRWISEPEHLRMVASIDPKNVIVDDRKRSSTFSHEDHEQRIDRVVELLEQCVRLAKAPAPPRIPPVPNHPAPSVPGNMDTQR